MCKCCPLTCLQLFGVVCIVVVLRIDRSHVPLQVKHFKVTRDHNGMYVIGERVFTSIGELVEFYKTKPIFTTALKLEIFLDHPLPYVAS